MTRRLVKLKWGRHVAPIVKKFKLAWSWRAVVMLASFIAALAVNYWLVPTTFSIEASTERVTVKLPENPGLTWRLDSVEIVRELGGRKEPFSGEFRPAPKTSVLFERISGGSLLIQCEVASHSTSAGILRISGRPNQTLGADVSFYVDSPEKRADTGSTAVIPFTGEAEIGNELGLSLGPLTPVLRKGTVRILGENLLGKGLFNAGSVDLAPGDQVRVEDPLGLGVGFVLAGKEPGLTAVYRAIGRSVAVSRLRSRGYQVRTSLYFRIINDASLQLIWAATVAFCWFLRFVPAKAAVALALLLACGTARGDVVYVKGALKGTGLTRRRGVTCYVITASHIMGDQFTAEIVGPNNVPAKARIAQPANGEDDIVVLKIEGDDTLRFCSEPWPEVPASRFAGRTDWVAQFAKEDGSPGSEEFTLRDSPNRYLFFRPRTKDDRIFQGLSGSVIRIGGQIAGIAVSATKSQDEPQQMRAYQLEFVNSLVKTFFEFGADWRLLPPLDGPVEALEVNGGRLIAGTSDGHIFRFDETKRTWDDIGGSPGGRKLVCLRSVGSGLYASYSASGTNQSALALRYQGQWLEMGFANWLITSVRNNGSRLHIAGYGGYFQGIDVGKLTAIIRGLPPGPAINALEVVPGGVFAGLGPGGGAVSSTLYFLPSDKDEWSSVPGLKDQDIHSLASNGSHVFVGTTTGLLRINLDGTAPKVVNRGLPENETVLALTAQGSKIFAGILGAGVWLSTTEGADWVELNSKELKSEDVLSMKVRSGRELFVGTKSGKVYVTGI